MDVDNERWKGNFVLLEKVPVSILRFLRSSKVGSQTKSSHIWQNSDPLLESMTLARVSARSSRNQCGRPHDNLQKRWLFLVPCFAMVSSFSMAGHCKQR